VKKSMILMAALPLMLAACNKAAETPAKPAASNDMAGMDMTGAAKTGTGSGKITALDKAGGTVTIDHGPIPAVGWPAMTMGFRADPKLLEGVAVGDSVDFTLKLEGNQSTLTALARK